MNYEKSNEQQPKTNTKSKKFKGKRNYVDNQSYKVGSTVDISPDKLSGHGSELLERFKAIKSAEYLYAAINPKQAVNEGLDCKFPSDLPIPTACIRVSTTVPITTGANGNVFCNYIPGGLLTYNYTNGEQSGLVVNTTCNGSGAAGTNSFVNLPYFAVPQVYDKWRLTACETRVVYSGPILNTSGFQFSCVHYEPMQIAYKGASGTGTIGAQSATFLDRLSGNIALVKNGLWNQELNVQKNPSGRTHIFTPDTSTYIWPYNVGTIANESGIFFNNVAPGAFNINTAATTLTSVITTTGNNRPYRDWETDRKSTRLNSSHRSLSRMPSSA